MNFASITLREIQLPLKEPFAISSGMIQIRRILLLEIIDQSGATNWSECVAGEEPNYSPETIDGAWVAIRDHLAPRILGREFASPGEVHQALCRNLRGHPMARAALEMGAWGLMAVLEDVPLARLLGGTRAKVATGISLGIQASPEALVDKASQALAEGYQKIKIKIRPGADISYLQAVRDALGTEAPLMADANSAYSLDDQNHIAQWDELDMIMIEQPLGWDDLVRHAELQKVIKTPICLDESITSLARAQDMVSLGSGRIINLKPGRVGGFTESIAIHQFCVEQEIPVWCGGMLESGIGRAYNVALASLPGFILPGDISPSARYWHEDIVTPAWEMDSSGMVNVPLIRPGIGVDLNLERIAELTVRSLVLRPSDPKTKLDLDVG